MFKNKLNYKLLNILMFMVILLLGFKTFEYWSGICIKIISVLIPFIISFAIAYSLYPCVRKLEKRGVRKGIAVGLVVVIIIAIIVALFSITIPLIYEQLILLSKIIGQVVTDLSVKFEVNLVGFEDTINNTLDKLISNIGEYISTGTIDFLVKSVDVLTKTIIISIVSIYLLSDMDKIRVRAKSILKRINERAFFYVKAVDNELCNYLQGLVIFMIIQLIEYSFLFGIVGHPNWLLLGILASLTTVIPYFGGLATNIIAVVLASVVSPKLFIATMIICLVFPNIDGYIISPKVYGKTNNINPIWSIFSVFVGGALLGVLGIVIALPAYIVLNCTYNFFKKDIYGKIDDLI